MWTGKTLPPHDGLREGRLSLVAREIGADLIDDDDQIRPPRDRSVLDERNDVGKLRGPDDRGDRRHDEVFVDRHPPVRADDQRAPTPVLSCRPLVHRSGDRRDERLRRALLLQLTRDVPLEHPPEALCRILRVMGVVVVHRGDRASDGKKSVCQR